MEDALPEFVPSESLGQALVDPATHHQYAGMGIEQELDIFLDLEGDHYGTTVAKHVSGATLDIDYGRFYRWRGEAYASLAEAGLTSADKVEPTYAALLEYVSPPANIHPGEKHRLEWPDVARHSTATHELLRAVPIGSTLREALHQRSGWVVKDGFKNVRIVARPRSRESYVQFTVGVPMDGLYAMLRRNEEREYGNVRRALLAHGRVFGRDLATHFVEQTLGLSLQPGEIELLSQDPRVREIWGYGWLMFLQASAAQMSTKHSNVVNMVKNALAVALRNPIGRLRDELQDDIAEFLETRKAAVTDLFVRHLWPLVRDEEAPVEVTPELAEKLLDSRLAAYSTVREYLDFALVEDAEEVDQRAAIGMNNMSAYDSLDTKSGVPLALLELRGYGQGFGRMTEDQLRRYSNEIISVAQRAFEEHYRGGPRPDLRQVIQTVRQDQHMIRTRGAFTALFRARGQAGLEDVGAHFARVLSDHVVWGKPLPEGVAEHATSVLEGRHPRLVGTSVPTDMATAMSSIREIVRRGLPSAGTEAPANAVYPRPSRAVLSSWMAEFRLASETLEREPRAAQLRERAWNTIVSQHHVAPPPAQDQRPAANDYRRLYGTIVNVVAYYLLLESREGGSRVRAAAVSLRLAQELGTALPARSGRGDVRVLMANTEDAFAKGLTKVHASLARSAEEGDRNAADTLRKFDALLAARQTEPRPVPATEPAKTPENTETAVGQPDTTADQAATSRPADRYASLAHSLAERRPPRIDHELPPAPTRGTEVTFADGRRLPPYLTGGVGALLPGLPRDVADRSFGFGRTAPTLRGVDEAVREVLRHLGTSDALRPVPQASKPLLHDQVAIALRTHPHAFFSGGKHFDYRSASGEPRTLRMTARPYGRGALFAFGQAKPVKLDVLQRSSLTGGGTMVNSSSFALPLSAPVRVALTAVGLSLFLRPSVRLTFGRHVHFVSSYTVASESESRSADDSDLYLDDVWYEISVLDVEGQPLPVGTTGQPVGHGFAVRDGLRVDLSRSTLHSPEEAVGGGRLPEYLQLGENSHFRWVSTEGFGPVDHIRAWMRAQTMARAGSIVSAQIDDLFSSTSFQRLSRALNTGGVILPLTALTTDGRTRAAVYRVRAQSEEARLVSETNEVEIRDILRATFENSQLVSSYLAFTGGLSLGPGYTSGDRRVISVQMHAALTALYNAQSRRTVNTGGAASSRSVAQAKGTPTGLYLVRKKITVTGPPLPDASPMRRALRKANPKWPRTQRTPRTMTFQTWALERLPLSEAQRLAGQPVTWDTAEPVAPAYLAPDAPATLGMSRVEEFTFSDGNVTREINGQRVTFPEYFAEQVLAEIAKVHPGLVAPLHSVAPSAGIGLEGGHLPLPLVNTLEVLNALSYSTMASNLETMITSGLRVSLVDPGATLTSGHRYIWIDASLTDRRYEGPAPDLRLRYGVLGNESLFGTHTGGHAGHGGAEALVAMRTTARDSIGRPRGAATITLGGRTGRRLGKESGYGMAATHEGLAIGAGGAHTWSYEVRFSVSRGGFTRPPRWLRGLLSLNLLDTQPFVRRRPETPLFGAPLTSGAEGTVPGVARVLLSVPAEHTRATGVVRQPAEPGAITPMALAEARALALGTPEDLRTAAAAPRPALFSHPHQTLAVRSDRRLTAAVREVLAEAGRGSWLLTQGGTAAHDAALATFRSVGLTSRFDLSSAPSGWGVPDLLSPAPFLDRTTAFAYRTRLLTEEMTVLTDVEPITTEITSGGTTQAIGHTTRTRAVYLGGQLGGTASHQAGRGLTGTYPLLVGYFAERALDKARSLQAAAEITRSDSGPHVMVAAPVLYEVAAASSRLGRGAVGKPWVPAALANAAGRRLLVPDGWVGHLPEKTAYRLGVKNDGHGDVPLYTERAWSPLPGLLENPFGVWPITALDTAAVVAEFEEKLRPLGLTQSDLSVVRRLVSDRVARALAQELTGSGASVPTRVSRWSVPAVHLWLGSRRARVRAELVPVVDTGRLEALGHSVDLEESRLARESRQHGRSRTTGLNAGVVVSEGVHTSDPTVRSAGPMLQYTGTSHRTTTHRQSEATVRILTVVLTQQAHAEWDVEYVLRLLLEIEDGDPAESGPERSLGEQARALVRGAMGRRRLTVRAEGSVGRRREHLPLSLMRPGAASVPAADDPLAIQPLPPSGRSRRVAPEKVPVAGHFTMPESGFSVRRIIGLDELHAANTVALGSAYNVSLAVPMGTALTDDDVDRAARTPLTQAGTGAAQSLEDGTSNAALTGFFEQAVDATGYEVPGLADGGLFGGLDGSLTLFSRPDLTRARLITVADGVKFEHARRTVRSTGLSTGLGESVEQTLFGGPTAASPATPATGTNQMGQGSAVGEDEASKLTWQSDRVDGVNAKPESGRGFLFAVPTKWWSVAQVHHRMKDSSLGRALLGPFGAVNNMRQAMETDTYAMAWVREDVARHLGLIDDGNFPRQVARAWDAVTAADEAWTAADKRYWSLRRTGQTELKAALAVAQMALDELRERDLDIVPSVIAAQAALDELRAESGEADDAETRPEDQETLAERIAQATRELEEVRRAARAAVDEAVARKDRAQAELDAFPQMLEQWRAHAVALAGHLADRREYADRITAWHRLAATPEGRALLGDTPRPVAPAAELPAEPGTVPAAETVEAETAATVETADEAETAATVETADEAETPATVETADAERAAAPGSRGLRAPVHTAAPWQRLGATGAERWHYDVSGDPGVLTITDADGWTRTADLLQPGGGGNGFFRAAIGDGVGQGLTPAALAADVAARVSRLPDAPFDPEAVYRPAALDKLLTGQLPSYPQWRNHIEALGWRLPGELVDVLPEALRRQLTELNIASALRWDDATEAVVAEHTAQRLGVDLVVVAEDGSPSLHTATGTAPSGSLPGVVVHRRGQSYLAVRPRLEEAPAKIGTARPASSTGDRTETAAGTERDARAQVGRGKGKGKARAGTTLRQEPRLATVPEEPEAEAAAVADDDAFAAAVREFPLLRDLDPEHVRTALGLLERAGAVRPAIQDEAAHQRLWSQVAETARIVAEQGTDAAKAHVDEVVPTAPPALRGGHRVTRAAETTAPASAPEEDLLDPEVFHARTHNTSELRSLSRLAGIDSLLRRYQAGIPGRAENKRLLLHITELARAYAAEEPDAARREVVERLAEQARNRANTYRKMGIREQLKLAQREWRGSVPEGVRELEQGLIEAGHGARSMVLGIDAEQVVWAVNTGGEVTWHDHFGTPMEAPREAAETVRSIDLNPKSFLIEAPQELVAEGTDATRFCQITPGANLRNLL
ncbi:hypothetical protein ABZ614_20690 [Streptomyces sp. NPDC013178]|uniref:hypothetical protein n=1 Tax=Streptomyces sp. NPDC013178 TaxID=3155118 RepID=UPI0033D43962